MAIECQSATAWNCPTHDARNVLPESDREQLTDRFDELDQEIGDLRLPD